MSGFPKLPPIEMGERYGRWTVIEEVSPSRQGYRQYRCLCECGNKSVVPQSRLRKAARNNGGCFECHKVRQKRLMQGMFNPHDKNVHEKAV